MRVLSFLLLINLTLNSYSQEKITDSINTNWEKSGKFTFLGNQSSYSYWTAGGQTSVSGTIKINYDLNYENNGWNWDTKIITAYGLNSNGGSKFLKKTDDKLEINSLVGKKFSSSNIGDLSYSSFINFKTQWTKGYRFRTASSGEEERIERTRFLSPGYFQIGVGLYWEKSKDFWVSAFDVSATKDFTTNNWKGKNVLLFGSEGFGMRQHTGKYADFFVKINMNDKIESLNISNSAAIVFHHLSYIKKKS